MLAFCKASAFRWCVVFEPRVSCRQQSRTFFIWAIGEKRYWPGIFVRLCRLDGGVAGRIATGDEFGAGRFFKAQSLGANEQGRHMTLGPKKKVFRRAEVRVHSCRPPDYEGQVVALLPVQSEH